MKSQLVYFGFLLASTSIASNQEFLDKIRSHSGWEGPLMRHEVFRANQLQNLEILKCIRLAMIIQDVISSIGGDAEIGTSVPHCSEEFLPEEEKSEMSCTMEGFGGNTPEEFSLFLKTPLEFRYLILGREAEDSLYFRTSLENQERYPLKCAGSAVLFSCKGYARNDAEKEVVKIDFSYAEGPAKDAIDLHVETFTDVDWKTKEYAIDREDRFHFESQKPESAPVKKKSHR